jgi:hypothetical protein
MKQALVLYLGLIFSVLPGVAFPDTATLNQLNAKIEAMNSLLAAMEGEQDEWRIRAAMQEHALLMKESIELSEQLSNASDKGALDGRLHDVGDQQALDEGAIRDIEYRMMMTLMRHVVMRQNILMERLGLFK